MGGTKSRCFNSGYNDLSHLACSREVCDQCEGIPLSSLPFRSTKSCFIVRNTGLFEMIVRGSNNLSYTINLR